MVYLIEYTENVTNRKYFENPKDVENKYESSN